MGRVTALGGRRVVERAFHGALDGTWTTAAFALTGVGLVFVTMIAVRPLPGATVADLCFVAATLLLLPSLLFARPAYFRIPTWLVVSAGGMAVAVLISTAANTTLLRSNFVSGMKFTVTLFLMPLLLGAASATRERVAVLTDCWLLGATVNAAVAVSDFLKITNIGLRVSGFDFRYVDRAAGLTTHPNHLGLVVAMALPVAVSRAIPAAGRRRVAYIGAALLLALGVFVSGSRTELVAGVVGIVALALLHPWGRKQILGALAACFVAVAVVSTVLPTARTDVLVGVHRLIGSDPSGSVSDSQRSTVMRHAISQFDGHPVTGVGFAVVRDAHSLYLQLLAAGGVLPFLSFLVYAGGILLLGLRLRRADALPAPMQNLAAALTASILVWLVGGIVANQIYDRYLYVPVGLLVGLWFAELRTASPTSVPSEATSRIRLARRPGRT